MYLGVWFKGSGQDQDPQPARPPWVYAPDGRPFGGKGRRRPCSNTAVENGGISARDSDHLVRRSAGRHPFAGFHKLYAEERRPALIFETCRPRRILGTALLRVTIISAMAETLIGK